MLRAVILLLIAVSTAVKGDNSCIPYEVGENRMVCVCNSTYCDYAPNISVEENEYVQYTSTRSGERMKSSVASFSNDSTSDNILTVDRNTEYQTISGFGGAMTDAAAINIRTLSNKTQENLIKSYYSDEGSMYTFCRIPIAGTDFSTRPYTYDDTPGDVNLTNFALVEEDDYKIDYLHQIKSVMPKPDSLKIFTAAWSAPPWMKTTNEITWGALKHEYYQVYANYICKFFDAYKERDIHIWGMTPGNEPIDGAFPFFPFNAMLWTPQTEAIFSADYLAPTLSKARYDLVYMAMDDQRFEMPWFSDWVFKDPKAEKLFSGTAFHWYSDKTFSPSRSDELHNMYPDKFILMTEACTGSNPFEKEKVILGSWERGEEYLWDIIENLSHWAIGWVDWNLALDKYGAPNWAKNFVDSPIITVPEKDEFYKQPMYYALYHVSRYVPPNSTRIAFTGFEKRDTEINGIAFLTPEEIVVIVMINRGDEPYNITIQDKQIPSKFINIQLPERSFTTLEYKAQQ